MPAFDIVIGLAARLVMLLFASLTLVLLASAVLIPWYEIRGKIDFSKGV